jgi:peroxiredoxin
MVSLTTPRAVLGWPAPDFRLPATDGRFYSLAEVRGVNGLVVMFLCNHCPYVRAIMPRLVPVIRELAALGIGSVAISANDATLYPEDDFPHMKAYAKAWGLPCPYLYDAEQHVARAYGAVCTPDFFGFDAGLQLRYRGRFDAAGKRPAPPEMPCDLLEAMKMVALLGVGPDEQMPGMGCAIKWRDGFSFDNV